MIMKKTLLSLLVIIWLASCNNNPTAKSSDTKNAMMPAGDSKTSKNKQTALTSVMAINQHDIDAILKDVTSDATDYYDGSGPPIKGLDSVRAGMKSWFGAFPDVRGEDFLILSDDDGSNVAVVATWTGTFKNDYMGMKATGKSFKYRDADIFTFNSDGKITSHKSIVPGESVMKQVMPMPAK